jgi:hypothetical protein
MKLRDSQTPTCAHEVHTLLLAGLAALVALGGCSNEARLPVFPVSGNVSFNAEPPVGAQVVLHPVNGSIGDAAPTGIVKSDGSFTITTYELDDGAPQGEYVATIEWFKMIEDGGGGARGPNVLPPEYASSRTSPVKVTVTEAGSLSTVIQITGRVAGR